MMRASFGIPALCILAVGAMFVLPACRTDPASAGPTKSGNSTALQAVSPAAPAVPARPAVLATASSPSRPPAPGKASGPFFVTDGIAYVARTEGKAFSIYSGGTWKKTFLKGVNIGAGVPGRFPGELAIGKDEYLRWFSRIGEMNAQVIRVYTTMMPQFYDALLEYNSRAREPLWLLQGVWLAEELIAKHKTAYADDDILARRFSGDAKDLVDVIHGNATLPSQPGFASGTYTSDVSRWVIGWILGIEWDPYFIAETDSRFPERNRHAGRFLSTANASPFEAFLCRVCDETVAYEVDKYRMMRPMAVNNWPTTDPLRHPNEPYESEDMSTLDVRHIVASPSFHAGWFASYHIYPYYPDFINYDTRYAAFRDADGKADTYRAYIRDLMSLYQMPVLVAEFGLPASRGMAHRAPHTGYNQGMHTEREQGEKSARLLRDIHDEGYCGAILFAWQDEWFKRTWNTMDLDLPDSRPLWSNVQTNEQCFGLLSFDPGAASTVCHVDGDLSEWKDDIPVAAGKGISIHAKTDERYVYLMARVDGYLPLADTLVFALDTIPGQGNTEVAGTGIRLSHPADFLVRIAGKNDSRVLVDAYYDPYYYLYAESRSYLPRMAERAVKGSGVFSPIMLALSRQIRLPETGLVIPFSGYETGILRFGDSNPGHPEYDSLADFFAGNGFVELRIPWQLLNVMDPSRSIVIADLYSNKGIRGIESGEWRIGAGMQKVGAKSGMSIGMKPWKLRGWKMPGYHERLKESYHILRNSFREMK